MRVRAGWPVAAAATAWVAASTAYGIPIPVLVAVVAVAVGTRRRTPVMASCLVLLAVVDVAAARSLAGLDDLETGEFDAPVAVLTDAKPMVGGGVRFEADSDVGHLLVEVTGPVADEVEGVLAGMRVVASGRVEPFEKPTEWTASRHLVGTLEVVDVRRVDAAGGAFAVANAYRDLLARGAESLAPRHRSLLSGILIGDDRAQPPELTADFRASGLTHLLAVSGQNLVFVLVVASPLLRRLRLWPRYVVAVSLIAAFATVTRFEPSVTRAAAVATVALLATTLGRPADGLRHLALAVTALIVIDPMLVRSVGFRLSVAASVGVLALAPTVIAALRGPRWFREGLGVTVGAQIAVAPVLVPTFGAMPLAALPANVLAAPVAGFVMVWGLVAGTVAGVVGGSVAATLHLPTAVALSALEAVARRVGALPLGRIDLRHVAVLAAAAAALWLSSRLRVAAGVVAVAVVVAAVIARPTLGEHRIGFDATVWVDGPVAVVVAGGRADPVEVLDRLHRSRVRAVGLFVSEDGDADDVIDAVRARLPIGGVIGPADRAGDVSAGQRIRVARMVVFVDDVSPRLRVRVGWR